MYEEEIRLYKNVPTTEMLDFLMKEFDYNKKKELKKQQDYRDELEHRTPFKHFKDKIDNMSKEIQALKNLVAKLSKHKHTDGDITIPLKDLERGYF